MGEPDDTITPTNDMNPWRAGCSESCTSGSEGGPQKPTHRKMGRALRPDPYTYVWTLADTHPDGHWVDLGCCAHPLAR